MEYSFRREITSKTFLNISLCNDNYLSSFTRVQNIFIHIRNVLRAYRLILRFEKLSMPRAREYLL